MAFVAAAFKFIKLLKKFKVKLCLLTSDTKHNAEEAIKVLKLSNYFDCVIGGDSGFGDKKSGDSCRYICNNLNLDSKKVISIGDAPVDHEMAINANLKGSILVESGQIKLDKLREFSKYCIKDLSKIRIESVI